MIFNKITNKITIKDIKKVVRKYLNLFISKILRILIAISNNHDGEKTNNTMNKFLLNFEQFF